MLRVANKLTRLEVVQSLSLSLSLQLVPLCLDEAWFAFTTLECESSKLCKYLQLPQPITNK